MFKSGIFSNIHHFLMMKAFKTLSFNFLKYIVHVVKVTCCAVAAHQFGFGFFGGTGV
jgi:hypothetical protein